MKRISPFWGGLLASPAMAHSGVHAHSHGVSSWNVVALAAVIVVGTMTFFQFRRRT
jgi:hypothetical protein